MSEAILNDKSVAACNDARRCLLLEFAPDSILEQIAHFVLATDEGVGCISLIGRPFERHLADGQGLQLADALAGYLVARASN